MTANNLALLFTVGGVIIALVSLYYIKSHIEKLRKVKWK